MHSKFLLTIFLINNIFSGGNISKNQKKNQFLIICLLIYYSEQIQALGEKIYELELTKLELEQTNENQKKTQDIEKQIDQYIDQIKKIIN